MDLMLFQLRVKTCDVSLGPSVRHLSVFHLHCYLSRSSRAEDLGWSPVVRSLVFGAQDPVFPLILVFLPTNVP